MSQAADEAPPVLPAVAFAVLLTLLLPFAVFTFDDNGPVLTWAYSRIAAPSGVRAMAEAAVWAGRCCCCSGCSIRN